MLSAPETRTGTQNAAQTLESLVTQDQATGGDKSLDNAWKGAEAFHFLMLAQRQLYAGKYTDAMRTSLRLREYKSNLDAEEIYSLITLSAFYAHFYAQCSLGFVKLRSLSLSEKKQEQVAKLALNIFTRHQPVDPSTR